jgi:hypothetical protein
MNLLHLLLLKGSRKVGFGLWLFIVANIYLWFKVIASGDWMTCVALSSALVGGGTLGDKFLENQKNKLNADAPKQ